MSPWGRYLIMMAGVLAVVVLVAMVALEGSRRAGLLAAGGMALGVQLVAFGLLERYRARPNGFLAGWLGGSALRLAGLGGMVVLAVRNDGLDLLWSLLGLTGLFFVLHLLEPVALRGAEPEPGTGTESG